MPTDLEAYKEHISFIAEYAESASKGTVVLTASWCHYRNFANARLTEFISRRFGDAFINDTKAHLGDVWARAVEGDCSVDRDRARKLVADMDEMHWDHEDVLEQDASLEHPSWIAILILDSAEDFLKRSIDDSGRIPFTPALDANIGLADYVDQMEIGRRTDYPASEMDDQRQFLARVAETLEHLDISMLPNKIELK